MLVYRYCRPKEFMKTGRNKRQLVESFILHLTVINPLDPSYIIFGHGVMRVPIVHNVLISNLCTEGESRCPLPLLLLDFLDSTALHALQEIVKLNEVRVVRRELAMSATFSMLNTVQGRNLRRSFTGECRNANAPSENPRTSPYNTRSNPASCPLRA